MNIKTKSWKFLLLSIFRKFPIVDFTVSEPKIEFSWKMQKWSSVTWPLTFISSSSLLWLATKWVSFTWQSRNSWFPCHENQNQYLTLDIKSPIYFHQTTNIFLRKICVIIFLMMMWNAFWGTPSRFRNAWLISIQKFSRKQK